MFNFKEVVQKNKNYLLIKNKNNSELLIIEEEIKEIINEYNKFKNEEEDIIEPDEEIELQEKMKDINSEFLKG